MIVVHNRSLIIPPEEYCIGNDYDTHTDSRIFRVNRILGGIDIANLLFKLDLQYADGSADTLAMEPEIKDDYVCLLWTITKNQLQIPGTVLAQIRALNIDGKMKWTSNMGAFFVENSIFSSGNYEGKLSEIEQFEAILPAEKARAQNELKREQEFKDMKSASEKATAAANEAAKKAESYTLGDISDKTVNFNQAAELANIISGEAISIVLGKVSKAIATTMSLDQNALLKSMLSSVDVNDTNKIPTSAYIHSLVERIGMGTALNTGSNLTNAVNQLNSDLPSNFKFLNLKYDTASSYDTEVLKYIESLKESVFIIYCQHGSASMYMGFIVGDGKYGTVLRFEYDSLYVNGCSGNAWAGWTKLG